MNFKDAFTAEIEAQLLEVYNMEIAIGNVRDIILLFKSELPKFTNSSLLAHITDRNEDSKCSGKLSKMKSMKPHMFHEAFCKTGINAERLTRVKPKITQNMTIAKPNMQQQVRGTLSAR